MTQTFVRTALSTTVRVAGELSAGVFDRGEGSWHADYDRGRRSGAGSVKLQ
jgi:hypothetical protein